MSDIRAKILLTMSQLIEKQGYHATGLNEIIEASGAPKGSVYYYFPGGKEQIAAEAIVESGKIISAQLRTSLERESSPAEAVFRFMLALADRIDEFQFGVGSPLTTAAVETSGTSEMINQACREAFAMILAVFSEKFQSAGHNEADSAELALYITTVVEGGMVMCRTYNQAEPLRLAARHLRAYLTQKTCQPVNP